MSCQRVSVLDASKEIGCDVRQVRAWMRNGVVDLGFVTKAGSKYDYFIFRAKLDKFLGKESTNEGLIENA